MGNARLGTPNRMIADMNDQPSVLLKLYERRSAIWRIFDPYAGASKNTAFVARGSSLHAAIYGRYVVELATRRPAYVLPPSLHTRFKAPTTHEHDIVIAISQSGATPEILETVASVARSGAITVGITNVKTSPLSDAAGYCVFLDAGPERAIPATKTFTAELAAIHLAAQALAGRDNCDDSWTELVSGIAGHLDNVDGIQEAATAATAFDQIICLGRGFLYPIALEAALKIIETSRVPSFGYSSTEFLHGPISQASERSLVLVFVDDDQFAQDARIAEAKLRGTGAMVISIGPSRNLVPNASLHVETFPSSPSLTPIVHAVMAQQFARYLALARGQDPDRPPGLSKITAT